MCFNVRSIWGTVIFVAVISYGSSFAFMTMVISGSYHGHHVDRYKTFARRTSDDRISERAWLDISEKLGKMEAKKWR